MGEVALKNKFALGLKNISLNLLSYCILYWLLTEALYHRITKLLPIVKEKPGTAELADICGCEPYPLVTARYF